MKSEKNSSGKRLNYFAVLKGVKLPWLTILFSFAFSILMMRAELQVAAMTADIIDTSQKAINAAKLIAYISAAVISAVCSIFSNYFTNRMEELITLGVRMKIWNKIMHLPTRYYDEDNGDTLVSRVTSDASAPASLFSMAVSCVVCVVTTVQAFVQLFSYHTTLALYSLLIVPLTLLLCIGISILQFKLGVYSTTTIANSTGYLAERVRNFRLIKSAVAEKIESEKGSRNFKEMYKADFFNWMVVALYQVFSSITSILFIFIIFVIGGQLVPKGEVTIGDLTSFYMVTGIVSLQLMQFFMNAGSVFGTFGTMKKITQICELMAESSDGDPVPALCADIVFSNVTFGYNEERDVLKEVSVNIPMGKVTAVIGGNGAGKSTIFKLLTRLYEPDEGRITFNGENIANYNLTEWRDRFSYVFQKNPLISGTVRENITYGLNREVTDEELTEVTKKANCYDCIMSKPGGFDEDVGLNGSNFSGGQGQCISIARAMLRDADYLLLDEATSNLDVVSEAMVTEALDNLMKNKTTIMIAHNYAATKNADNIIVMRDGRVEASGTPEEMLKNNAYYQMFAQTL